LFAAQPWKFVRKHAIFFLQQQLNFGPNKLGPLCGTVICTTGRYYTDPHHAGFARAYASGGVGGYPWACYVTKNFVTCAYQINYFRILFACWFVDLLQIPRNEIACKFQGTLQLGQNVIIKFWWKAGLSSAYRNHLTTFCRPFVHYACLRLCSAVVHFIRNNCLFLSVKVDQRKRWAHWLQCQFQ